MRYSPSGTDARFRHRTFPLGGVSIFSYVVFRMSRNKLALQSFIMARREIGGPEANGESRSKRRRRIGAALVSILVTLVQVSPALACAVLDGPGGSGCATLFRGAAADWIVPAGETEREPGDTRDDCWTGPEYLAADDVQPSNIPESLHGHPVAHSWQSSQTADAILSLVSIVPREWASRGSSEGRRTYLATRRLRI